MLQVRRKSLSKFLRFWLANMTYMWILFHLSLTELLWPRKNAVGVPFGLSTCRQNGTSNISRDDDDDPDLIIGGDSVGDNKVKTLKVWSALELPAANYYDGMWFMDENNSTDDVKVRTTLRIRTNVKASEVNVKYRRRFRVDRIRFVPVP